MSLQRPVPRALHAQQRQAAAGRWWRRARLVTLGLAAAVVAVAAVWGISHLSLGGLWAQPVRSVAVEGDFRFMQRERIVARLEAHTRGRLMTISLDDIRAALMDDPWVDGVSVRRHWPDRLSIRITEQQPIAYWGDTALVNHRGELFQPDRIPVLADLPVLHGPVGSARDVMQRYQELKGLLAAAHLDIARLQMDERQAWRLQLVPDMELVFGQGDLPAKLNRFLIAWQSELQEHATRIERIDLRYGNGLAVRWRGGVPPWKQPAANARSRTAGETA